MTSKAANSTRLNKRSPTASKSVGRRRPYDALKTQQRILDCARASFVLYGFDHVSLRSIAADAEVDPALVIRYFESKEKLFMQAVQSDLNLIEYCPQDLSQMGAALALALTDLRSGEAPSASFLMALRSAPNKRAAELLNDKLKQDFIDPISDIFKEHQKEDAEARAALMASVLIGMAFTRDVIKSKSLNQLSQAKLRQCYGQMLQACIDAEI